MRDLQGSTLSRDTVFHRSKDDGGGGRSPLSAEGGTSQPIRSSMRKIRCIALPLLCLASALLISGVSAKKEALKDRIKSGKTRDQVFGGKDSLNLTSRTLEGGSQTFDPVISDNLFGRTHVSLDDFENNFETATPGDPEAGGSRQEFFSTASSFGQSESASTVFKRNLQSIAQPSCQTWRPFPMIFGLDQTSAGCQQNVDLTGIGYHPSSNYFLIAGAVSSSNNCPTLGVAGTIRRAFLVMTDGYGVVQWARHSQNQDPFVDMILQPTFFRYIDGSAVTRNVVLSVLTKAATFNTVRTSSPWGVSAVNTYTTTLRIAKTLVSDGTTALEQVYSIGANILLMSDFRVATDVWDTTANSMYLVTAVKSDQTDYWVSTTFWALFMKINIDTMDVLAYSTFGVQSLETLPLDIRRDTTNLWVLIRHEDNTDYTPGVFKINPSTMVVTENVAASTAAIRGSKASYTGGLQLQGRIGVCESLGYFFMATQSGQAVNSLQLTGGTTGTLALTRTTAFVIVNAGPGLVAQPIPIFALRYQCSPTEYLVLIYSQQNKLVLARFPTPSASMIGTQPASGIIYRVLNRGTATKPINFISAAWSGNFGYIAWSQPDYLNTLTVTSWYGRIVMHKIDFFSGANIDYYTYNCIGPTSYSLSEGLTTTTTWANAAMDNTYPSNWPLTNGLGVITTPSFSVPMFSTVGNTQSALTIHPDTLINSTNYDTSYYMMYDVPTWIQPACISGAAFCPNYTVECNPPYDWSPQFYNFDIAVDPVGNVYDAPTVRDCTGRYIPWYDNPFRLPSGLSPDDIITLSGTTSGQLTANFLSTNNDQIGTRAYRFKYKLHANFDKNIYLRFNVYDSSNTVKAKDIETNNPSCLYDKIYPFLLGYSQADVNVTFSGLDNYGNIMLAGWGSKFPFSTSASVTYQQGYFALINQRGIPYWVYYIKDVTSGATPNNNYCTYMRHYTVGADTNDYLFVTCNVMRVDLSDSLTMYKEAPMLMKLYHDTGRVIFMRYLPVDAYSNVMAQNGLYAAETSANNFYAVWRYRYYTAGPPVIHVQSFAGITFDSTFNQAAMTFRVFTGPDSSGGLLNSQTGTKTYGWFSTNVLADSSNFYVIVNSERALGVWIYSISTAMVPQGSGQIVIQAGTSAYSEIQPCLLGTTDIIIPILNNLQSTVSTAAETLYLAIVTRATLVSKTLVTIPLNMRVNVRNVAVTTDSTPNTYVVASEESMVFYKFDANFGVLKQKILKATGTAGKMYVTSISNYRDTSIFIVLGGKWNLASDKESVAILRSNSALDFGSFTCGLLIQDFQSWDTTWVSGTQPSTAANTALVTAGPVPTFISGLNYPNSNWPLMMEAHSVILQTVTFDTTRTHRESIGAVAVPNFYKYPEADQKCYMYEVYKNQLDVDAQGNPIVLLFEFKLNNGQQTITPTQFNSSVTNCQGRTQKMRITTIHNNGSTSGTFFPWLTFDDTSIYIDTDAPLAPESAQITVRYFDELAGESFGYFDFVFHIRINSETPIEASQQSYDSLQKCSQNIFPVSYGGKGFSQTKGDDMITYGFNVITDDKNILLSGTTKNLTHTDGATYDGFVMRLTPLGFIQWLSYLSFKQAADEYVGGVVYGGSPDKFAYCMLHSSQTTVSLRKHAIVKLTYEEGKMGWAKTIQYQDPIYYPPEAITRDSAWMIDVDPQNANRFVISTMLNFGTTKGYHPAISVVLDDTTTLLVQKNYFIKPQTTSTLNVVPSISNTMFQESIAQGLGAYMGISHFLDATGFRNLMFMRFSQSTGNIVWATQVAGSAAMPIEAMTQPHLYLRKNKLFTSTAVNTATAGQIGCVYVSTFDYLTGTQLANKLAIVDTSYAISNAQIIPDLTNTASTGFNVFLIVTLKNGYYIYIQQLDDSLTFTTSALKYHPSTSPVYVDTTYNHKMMVQPILDSFYLAVNFKQFFQTVNTKVESVILKQDYNIKQSGMYNCHQWTDSVGNVGMVNTFAATLLTASQISNVIFQWNTLSTIDNQLVRNLQMHNYPDYYYPQREQTPAHTYDELLPSTVCQTIQPPQLIELPSLTMLLNETKSTTAVTPATFTQCQGMPFTYTMSFQDSGTQAQTASIDEFILIDETADSSIANLDTTGFASTATYIKPSYRALKVKACLTISNAVCSTHTMPVMIFDPDMVAVDRTAATRTLIGDCLPKTEFPKVLSDQTTKTNAFLGMHIDQAQGNVFLCGWSLLDSHKSLSYPDSGKKMAITLLLSNLGDVLWHYSFRSIKKPTASDLSAQACRFAGTGDSMYILIYDLQALEMSIMKQSYDKGSIYWIRKLPGTFADMDGVASIENDYDASGASIINTLYVTARYQAAVGDSNQWHLYKIDVGGSVPRQMWHSYRLASAAQDYQGIDQIGITAANVIIAASFFETTTRRHAIIQVDKQTGAYGSLQLKVTGDAKYTSTSAATTFKSQAFQIDKATGGGLYYTYVERLDKIRFALINELTFVKTYEFEFPIAAASAPWISITLDELDQANGYGYILFMGNIGDGYLTYFKKDTGVLQSFSKVSGYSTSVHQFTSVQYSKPTGQTKYVYMMFSATQYVNSAQSGVINRIKNDLTFAVESCIGPVAQTLPTRTATTSIAAFATPLAATLVGTYINLFTTEKIYGEIVNWALPLGFGLRSAENLGCVPPPPFFNSVSPHQQILVAPSGDPTTKKVTIPGGKQCPYVVLLMGDWSVDRQTPSKPSWISLTTVEDPPYTPLTGNGGEFTMEPTNTEIGTYSVRVKYYSPVNSGTVEQTFLVDVYPDVDYAITPPTSYCVSDIYPLTYGNRAQISVLDGDYDGTNFIMCGTTQSSLNARNTGYSSAFVQSLNKNMMVNYQLIFEAGTFYSVATHCQFSNSQHMYIGVNSKSVSAAGNFDKIQIYKYLHNKAKFVTAKMLSAPGQLAELTSMVINTGSGDQFYAGRIQSTRMQVNAGEMEAFVMRLDTNMGYVWLRTFQGGTTDSVASSVLFDPIAATTGVYTHIKQLVTVGKWAMKLVKLTYGGNNSTGGTPLWGYYIYEATNLAVPKGMGGIAKDSTYVYSCMVISNAAGSLTQTLVMKFEATTGAKVANLDFNTPNAIDCNVFYHSASSKLLLNMQLNTETSQLIHFDASGTNLIVGTMTARLRFVTTGYQQLGMTRMFLQGSDVWIFYPSTNTGNTYSSMFITKMNDVASMNWDPTAGCTTIHQQDVDSTLFAAYQYIAPNYGGDSQDTGAVMVKQDSLTIPSNIPASSVIDAHITSPDMIAIFYDTPVAKPDLDLKFSYSATCSVWARPTPSVMLNRALTSGLSVSADNYTIVQPTYDLDHCQALNFTYTASMYDGTALLSWMWFDPDLITYYFTPNTNDRVGIYNLNLTGTLVTNATRQQLPSKTTTTFRVDVIINIPPTIDSYSYLLNESIYAHQNWNITARYENDQESNDPFMDAEFVQDVSGSWVVQPKPSWFIVNNATSKELYIGFLNPPQPAVPTDLKTLYIIRMRSWDIYNELTPSIYFIYIWVKNNYPPYMKPAAIDLAIPTIQVPYNFAKTFWYNNFADDEGDEILIDCTKHLHNSSLTPNWTLVDNNKSSGNITIYGQCPKDNARAGSYEFYCVVQDQFKDGNFTQYIFTMTVTSKPGIIITGTPTSVSSRLPNGTEVTTAPFSYDVDGLAYRKILYVNNTYWTNLTYGWWLTWDEPTQTVKITPSKNENAGLHQIGVLLNDGITSNLWINFTMEVIPNWPLNALVELPNRQAIVDNWFYFDFDKTEIFVNPEVDLAVNYSIYFRQKDSKPPSLPYFIKYYPNGTLYGLGTQNDIGSYQIECVGVDDALWETTIEFTLAVKPCYYKCSACWNTDYNTCQQCKKGYFLLNTECNDVCPQGAYADNVLNKCFSCSEECKICTGPDHKNDCQVCNTGYYMLNSGCWDVCPDGYWGDNQDYYCKPCNEACTKCVGPLSTQCQQCAELTQTNEIGYMAKVGYLLVGTQCQVPKCGDGQYFLWDTVANEEGNILGTCDACHETCKKCVGKLDTQCISCVSGRQLVPETHKCLLCEEINSGLKLNEEMECEDRCGDGVIVNKPCDDGNVFNGDGCSKNCYIEYGFECLTPGQPCREIIPPTFKITANSLTNQHFVEFSEPVLISTDTTIAPENMNVDIIGKRSTYIFSWRIVQDVSDDKGPTLIPGKQIIKFSIKLFDIKTTLTGSELVRVTFKDYSQIQDLNGNLIVNNSFAERNPAPFTYISDDEANAVAGGGESMKYAFLSAMGFQLGLKVIINGSMQYLWGLVHALQVFQYLLLLNIDFPPNLPAFTSYFSIASGDTDSMGVTDYIPDIKKWLIDVNDIEGQYDNEILPPKFVEQEISPYFIIAYSDKLNVWILAGFILLPILILLTKICKKVKVFENILGGFFFNGPLRTIVEMYFEMVITIVVNVNFVKFRNRSQMIASATAFGFGAFSLLLPFILMSVIYANRKSVRKRVWKVKFGMLTDEFSQKTITQLYYTPVYLFQRMTFSATIVFLYSYPLLQCFICAGAIMGMIAYLVVVRPYKEENQQTTTVVDEIILLICLFFFVYIYLNQDTMDVDSKKNLGWIIILIMMFSILKNLFVLLYFGFLNMRKKMKAMFSAEDEALDSPHTSDDNSDTIDSIDTDEIEEDVRQEEIEKEAYNERMRKKEKERKKREREKAQFIEGEEAQGMIVQQPIVVQPAMMYDQWGRAVPMVVQPVMMMVPQSMMAPGQYGQAQMAQSPKKNERMVVPGQLVDDNADIDAHNETPIGPNDAKKAAQRLKQNNFFSAEKTVKADEAINELEQVANEDADYGYDYGDYGDYGAEYGAEQAPEEKEEEKAEWGETHDQPQPPQKADQVMKFTMDEEVPQEDDLFEGAQEEDFDQVLEEEAANQGDKLEDY